MVLFLGATGLNTTLHYMPFCTTADPAWPRPNMATQQNGLPDVAVRGTTPSRARSGSPADMSGLASPPTPPRTGRDPAVAVWVLAGAGRILTAGPLLAGIGGGCHDAVAPVWATRRLSFLAATAFAAWLVMAGAMTLPTVEPLVRLFVPLTAHVPHPVVDAARVPVRIPG